MLPLLPMAQLFRGMPAIHTRTFPDAHAGDA
jgi:hypothetical protein